MLLRLLAIPLVLSCLPYASDGRRLQAASKQAHRWLHQDRQFSQVGAEIHKRIGLPNLVKTCAQLLLTLISTNAWQAALPFLAAGRTQTSAKINLKQNYQHAHGQLAALCHICRHKCLCMLAADDEAGEKDPSSQRSDVEESTFEPPDSEAERKRRQAESLAWKAKMAALEVERLESEAAKIRAKASEDEEGDSTSSASPKTARKTSPLVDLANVIELSPDPSPRLFGGTTNRVAQLLVDGRNPDDLQLSEKQIEVAKQSVFDLNSFYVTDVEQTFVGTVFRGKLRTNASLAYEQITSRAAQVPELQDVRFFLLGDPLDIPTSRDGELEPSPVLLALPVETTSISQTLAELAAASLGLLSTIVTTLGFSISMYILADNGAILKALKYARGGFALLDIFPFDVVLPLAAALTGVQLLHELAHYGAAKVHGLEIGLPIFLPSYPAPFTGSITKLLSVPSSRAALFDFAIAGPACAGAFSLVLYLVGLFLSVDLPTPDTQGIQQAADFFTANKLNPTVAIAPAASGSAPLLPVIPSGFLQSSWLLGSLAQLVVPAATTSQFIALHPLAVVGFCGVLVNALQCLPIGRLDGGRVATAVLGRSTAQRLSTFNVYALALIALLGNQNLCLVYFGVIAALFQRAPELPSRNDLSGIDSRRETIALLTGSAALLTLLQSPWPISPMASSMPF